MEMQNDLEVQVDRRRDSERRSTGDRRQPSGSATAERRGPERRKAQRRRHIDPTTCEREYSEEEVEFMRALDDYKRKNGRMFPTCSEILEVLRKLGYSRSLVQLDEAASEEATAVDLTKSEATAGAV